MLTQLNELRDRAHATARAKGFYDDPTSELSVLSLIIEEIGEAISADRRGRRANMARYKKKLNNGLPQKLAYNSAIRGSLEEELADIAIRLLDYAGYRSIDLTITDEEFNDLNKSKEKAYNAFSLLVANLPVILWQLTREFWLYLIEEEEQVKLRIQVHLVFLISLAESKKIDLFFHIKEKMAYNECRPRKYNKKY